MPENQTDRMGYGWCARVGDGFFCFLFFFGFLLLNIFKLCRLSTTLLCEPRPRRSLFRPFSIHPSGVPSCVHFRWHLLKRTKHSKWQPAIIPVKRNYPIPMAAAAAVCMFECVRLSGFFQLRYHLALARCGRVAACAHVLVSEKVAAVRRAGGKNSFFSVRLVCVRARGCVWRLVTARHSNTSTAGKFVVVFVVARSLTHWHGYGH